LELAGMLRGLSPPHVICPELYILAGFFRDPLQRRQQAERMHASRLVDDCLLVHALCELDASLFRLIRFVEEIYKSTDGDGNRSAKKWARMANNAEKWTLWQRALREEVVQIIK
jgi:hypothetical protein